MMRHLFEKLSLVSFLIFMSTSCSTESQIDALNDNDLNLNVDISDDESNVQGLSFRDKWLESDELAIEVNGDVKKYKIADTSTGKILPSSGVEPFCFQSGSALTVNAWWPYSATPYTSWSVEADQSSDNAMLQSDLIMATAPQVAFASSASLNFEHLTANVLVHVINKDAVNDKNIGDIKVSFGQSDAPIKLDGKLNNGALTVNADGATAVVTPKDVTDAESGYAKSVAALLIPQTLNTNFITVTLGEKVYQTKLSDEVTLEAGKSNVFNVTVKKGYLEVEKVSATDWNKGSEVDVNNYGPKKEILGKNDFKIFDYVLTDGTYRDGGYRLYSDGTRELKSVSRPDNTCGIVIFIDGEHSRLNYKTGANGAGGGSVNNHPDALMLVSNINGKIQSIKYFDCSWGHEDYTGAYKSLPKAISMNSCFFDTLGDSNTSLIYVNNQENNTLFTTNSYINLKYFFDKPQSDVNYYYKYFSTTYVPAIGQWWDIVHDIFGCPYPIDLKNDNPNIDINAENGIFYINYDSRLSDSYIKNAMERLTFSKNDMTFSSSIDGGGCFRFIKFSDTYCQISRTTIGGRVQGYRHSIAYYKKR